MKSSAQNVKQTLKISRIKCDKYTSRPATRKAQGSARTEDQKNVTATSKDFHTQKHSPSQHEANSLSSKLSRIRWKPSDSDLTLEKHTEIAAT